jgi:nucleotide-binding universal stress UspA family protein
VSLGELAVRALNAALVEPAGVSTLNDRRRLGGPLHEEQPSMTLPRNILVPIDLGDHTTEVLDYAVGLANRLDAKLHLLHAAPVPLLGAEIPITVSETAINDIIAARRQDLNRIAASYAGKCAFASVELTPGDARNVIAEAAAHRHADLIVMGTHGRRGVSRLLIGSVAEQIARVAPCPVLLVRSGTAAAS